jgi:uncharacterized protein YdhG (YjbR/CyaY superfamily)
VQAVARAGFESVDEYVAAQPEAARRALQRVRGIIRKALPKADEVISYGIPTYKIDGRTVLHLAGWKRHYSLYPANARLIAAFQDELAPYLVEKSTLRFEISQPVPARLIERIAKFRLLQRTRPIAFQ